jgi:hypothetical protein
MDRETSIRNDFSIIPNIIEKRTSPFLYSFFSGLKNVLISKGVEKT